MWQLLLLLPEAIGKAQLAQAKMGPEVVICI